MKPVVIDLFCGAGGFSTGAKEAGFEVVLAVDCWPEALAVHAANHPETRHECVTFGEGIEGSVLSVARMVTEAAAGRPYHLHGSPPCQDLSTANPNGDRTEGMRLVNWFIQLVNYLEPPSWSMEQVMGVIPRLPTTIPVTRIMAADYGVPQTRVRAFAGRGWIANATHRGRWRSVLDALPHLEEEANTRLKGYSNTRPVFENGVHVRNEARTGVDGTKSLNEAAFTQANRPLSLVKINQAGFAGSHSDRALAADQPIDGPAPTICAYQPTLRLVHTGNAEETSPRNIANDPAFTITHISPRQMKSISAEKVRSLTLKETLTLQGFPDNYNLEPAKTQGARFTMVGNAVCPPVAAAVMRGLLKPQETLAGWL